ncbi:toxin-antitoxin system YwqK family antitoxin [Achromobacter insuavis]|uniref:toxin-antitoxin system YwqK family antitoxin n=1 Tax=Achromobacter insuavis TaxID=1287735 RepID=UPI0029DA61EF|nr:hypothetical protein [Achromobacter sp.]MCG2602436.1 hypothetical protein [Achromobacter sp.]
MPQLSRLVPLALCMTTLMALTGCGDELLDWRNAQLSNGKIYEGSANKPFSGKVTNVPYAKVLGPQQGYQALMGQGGSIVTMLFGSVLLCDVKVDMGVLDGDFSCHQQQSDQNQIDGSFKAGALKGKFVMRDAKTGNTITEAAFNEGRLDGKLKRYDASTKTVILEQSLSNGLAEGPIKQWNKDGKLTLDAHYVQGLLDGKYMAIDENSHITIKGAYQKQRFTGSREKVEYWNGIAGADRYMVTINEKFDADQITNQSEVEAARKRYRDLRDCVERMARDVSLKTGRSPATESEVSFLGQCRANSNVGQEAVDQANRTTQTASALVASAQQDEERMGFPEESNACTAAWTEAFRKENGEEALINYVQAWEFVDNCREGKRP